MQLGSTLVIGATFGIFLTIGAAWSEVFETVVATIVPHQGQDVLRGLLYASLCSVVGVIILVVVIRIDTYLKYATRRVTRRNLRKIAELGGLQITTRTTTVPQPGTTQQGATRRSRRGRPTLAGALAERRGRGDARKV